MGKEQGAPGEATEPPGGVLLTPVALPSPAPKPQTLPATKAERLKRHKSFFEGVRAEFEVSLEVLRHSFVDWQSEARRRRKSLNPITRYRLDFSPALEQIYGAYSHGRHIHLHNLALPIVYVVFFLICVYETVTFLPPPLNVLGNRVGILFMMTIFLILTRRSRWKQNRNLHLFALCVSFITIGESITFSQAINKILTDGGLASCLVAFACFLLVDTSFLWQTLSGILCVLSELVFLYLENQRQYPPRFVHAIVISSFLSVLGGMMYLYMCIRLARKLFLDQVLARLQEYQLEREKDRLQGLLHVILPKSVAARLTAGEQPISDRFENATVMFIEVLEFESVVATSSPLQAVKQLNRLYARFDAVCERNHVMRIKIMGTSYMAICGIPSIREHHAELACTAALSVVEELKSFCAEQDIRLGIRIGINSGPLVAGVIGVQKFCYDVWGDTVNTAARMCSHAAPGTIQTTATVRERIEFAFEFAQLDESFIKGKGKMVTHHLKAKKVFTRHTAPLPKLNLGALTSVGLANALPSDRPEVARPHLASSASSLSLTSSAPLMAPRRANTAANKAELEVLSRSVGSLNESSTEAEAPRPRAQSVTESSDDEGELQNFTRQRSSVTAATDKTRPRGLDDSLPGAVSSRSSDGHESSAPSPGRLVSAPRQGLMGLVRQTSTVLAFDDSVGSARSDSTVDAFSSGRTAQTQTGGLNRFRESLLRSASMVAGTPDSARGVFLSARTPGRHGDDTGVIDTSRMQRARNLAAAFGFDGVSASDKTQAEKARYAVRTWCCFLRFADGEMEHLFEERSVQDAVAFARLGYLWCLFVSLSGIAYDWLAFYNAITVRAVVPEAYSAADLLVPGMAFYRSYVSLGMLVGVRISLALPLVVAMLLTLTSRAVRLIPNLSVFAIWWVFLSDGVCIYLTAPAGILMASSRLVAICGSILLLMRGLNVKRQLLAVVVGFILLVGSVFLADPGMTYLINIATYTLPLFITAALLRSRLQVAQRTYFIERMKVARRSKEIAAEQEKADQILLNIFPKTIYERIKRGEREIVDNHRAALVLYADVVGFTKMSMEYTPGEIVETLNEIFCAFDALMGKYQLEKIKTIGDCFVCSAGVSTFNTSPFTNMASCALEMVALMESIRSSRGQKIDMRWGIHTGDVISAVVGEKRFLYDIFGEAVQTANLMESNSVAGRVLVSEPVAVALSKSGFVLKPHKTVQTASGVSLNTHFLMGRAKESSPLQAVPSPSLPSLDNDGAASDGTPSVFSVGMKRTLSNASASSNMSRDTVGPIVDHLNQSVASVSQLSVSTGSVASDVGLLGDH